VRATLLIAALAATSAAYADVGSDYAKGVAAAKDGKWAEVESTMKSVLAQKGDPAARMRLYGMVFDSYVPRYYLGLAAFRQGRCQDAVQNWEDPATRAIIAGNSALSGVADSGLRECKTRLAQTATPTPTTTTATPAQTTVAQQTPTTTPTRPPVSTPSQQPTQPPTQQPTQVARVDPPRPTQTQTQTQTTPPPRPAGVPAPASLVSALDNFLSGRYEAVASLNTDQISEPRAKYHALLVRAASRYTWAQMRGEQAGAPLLAQAQADVRAAKQLNASATPDQALFSPRFRQFYQQTR
jgi:hypothetical protein